MYTLEIHKRQSLENSEREGHYIYDFCGQDAKNRKKSEG